MAIFRSIHISFWSDAKVVDDFTPEDRYFYAYLLTNPHTNLCGCYEITLKQMSDELGYVKEVVERLIDRFEKVHRVLAYNKPTKEIILWNWHKYNWTASPKFIAALMKEIPSIKCNEFREYLDRLAAGDTVSIPYGYGMDTTGTVTVTGSVSDTGKGSKPKKPKPKPDKPADPFEAYANGDAALLEAFRGFEAMRVKIKKPMTDRAKQLLISSLEKLSTDRATQIAIIDQSTERCWQSLYALKGPAPTYGGGRSDPRVGTYEYNPGSLEGSLWLAAMNKGQIYSNRR